MADIVGRLPAYCGCGPDPREPCPACAASVEITRLRGEVVEWKRKCAQAMGRDFDRVYEAIEQRAEAAEAKAESWLREIDRLRHVAIPTERDEAWNSAIEEAAKVAGRTEREGFGGGAYNEGARDAAKAIRNLKRD